MGFAHIMGWLGDVQTMVGLHTTDSFLMEIVKDVISTVVLVSVGYIVTWFFKNILLPDRLKR